MMSKLLLMRTNPPPTPRWEGYMRLQVGRGLADGIYYYGVNTVPSGDNISVGTMGRVLELSNYAFGDTYWYFPAGSNTPFLAGGRKIYDGDPVGPYAIPLAQSPADSGELLSHEISLVQYKLTRSYGSWETKMGNLDITNITVNNQKFRTRTEYVTEARGPVSGHLSHIDRFPDLLKYAYDNNAELELRSFIF